MAAGTPTHFRTYEVFQNKSPDCRIWEAARATTAAPTFFKRIYIKDEDGLSLDYIDGGATCNNPTARLLAEAKHVFKDRHIASIVSIGTGRPRVIALPTPGLRQNLLPLDVVNMLRDIATDCEKTANAMSSRFENYPGVYFRFNVGQDMANIRLEAWEELEDVKAHTRQYLDITTSIQQIDQVVKAMRTRRLAVDMATATK